MITILILILLIAVVLSISRKWPPSSCTGNCNQGRNCTCVPKD